MALSAAKQKFIEDIAGYVQKYAKQYGILVHSPIIAQAILESGWGESKLSAKYHNYFGLKCGTKWKGPSVNMTTQEEYQPGVHTTIKDNFRVYANMEEGVKGYFEFIQLARYANLKGITDPRKYLETIKADGYATSSKYVDNVYKCITSYDLTKYDKKTGGTVSMGKTAQDVLNVMRSWLGYSEANGKFKQIIDLYNSKKPLPRGYAVKYTDEWCDTTVSAAGIKAGCSELIGRECGCEQHVKIFQSMGIWIEDGTITPKAGDIILYNWDTKVQPNNGYSDHIGYVESVSNGQITCIEGNKGEAVARRVISVGNGNIRGYARPKYSGTGTAPNVPNAPSKPTTPPTSGGGSLNKNVAWYGVVNTGTLKVRTWAGSENPQLKSYPTLTQGTKVGVCETVKDKSGDAWYYVKITGNQGEKYGFVAAAYITKQTTSKPNTEMKDDGVISKTPQWTGKVTADVLNVRSWAGTNNPLIKSWPKLNRGNLVDVCDVVNATDGSRWYYIRIAEKYYGFVHSAYIARS